MTLQLNIFQYAALKNSDEVLIKRARHVITEIQRTYEAAEALKGHNFVQVIQTKKQNKICMKFFSRIPFLLP